MDTKKQILTQKILNILNLNNKNSSVLEIGCGAGMLAQHFKCKYCGIDSSETLIKKHKNILGNNVLVAEANDLPFEDNSFDCVFSFSVFHYFPDKNYSNRVISEMDRVARKKIFIGDLPLNSHDNSHLLFSKNDFFDWNTSDGYHNQERFNVYRPVLK